MQYNKQPVLFFLLLMSSWYFSVGQEYEIQHWSLEEGLSNSSVNDILQDRYGFVWIATAHGLNRFDGHQFKTYRYHPLDSSSIGGNHIKNVIETEDGTIWAILSIGGLAKWHRNDETFSYYNHFGPSHNNKKIVFVADLIQVNVDEYLIGTQKGLFLLDSHADQPQMLFPSPEKEGGISIHKLHIDSKRSVWMSTSEGIFKFDLSEQKAEPICFYHPARDSLMEMKRPFSHMFEDNRGRLWMGTLHNGIFLYDELGGFFRGHWKQIDPTLSRWQTTSGLFQTLDGKLWCSLQQHGLFYYDENNRQFQQYKCDQEIYIYLAHKDKNDNIWMIGNGSRLFQMKNETVEEIFLPQNGKDRITLSDLYTDRDNGLWIASNGRGIWRIAKKRWVFQTLDALKDEQLNPSPSEQVTTILEDSQKNFWIGTKMGLIKSDSSLQHFELYNPHQMGSKSLSGFFVMDIMEDHLGLIWVGTSYGISVLDKKKGWIKNFRHDSEDDQSLSHNTANCIIQDAQNRIWIATNGGLNLYQPEKDQFLRFWHLPDNPHSIGSNSIRQIIPSSTPNVLWIGLTGAGLNKLRFFPENDSIACEHYFFESAHQHSQKIATINTLYEDKNQQLWIGAYSMGLLKFDQGKNRLVNAQPQVPTIPNIASIKEDNEGHLWIAANNGLWQYKPEEDQFRQFTHKNGLSGSQFSYQASCVTQDGRLFFGNTNGLDYFHPSAIGAAAMVAQPLIYSFRKYDQDIRFERPIYELEEIKLSYKDNYIHFDFLSPEFQHPESVQYAYKLEGFDKEWHYCKNPGQANYTNLPGGVYTFKVKAGNAEGEWNPKISSLQLEVIPPFWEKLWFRLLSVFIGLMLLFSFFRIRWALKMKQIHEVAKIREKAAADFHDELGHRLTKISLFSETLLRIYPKASLKLRPYLEKIKSNSDELYHSLHDFVWVMNPRKDSLLELAILLKDFGDELFDNTDIDFRVEGINKQLKAYNLNMDWKRHLVLIFKEAMHNSLKHSQCKNVTLLFSVQHQTMQIKLTDDGIGFVKNEKKQGYGIGNMQNRANKIGGYLSINGQTGTCIKFSGALPNV